MRLYYQEKGNGYPLIFLHGNGEDHKYFDAQVKYFSRYFKTIAIDTRGHGRSKRGKKPFTISQFADDLYEFMQQKKIERAHILGFSDGGNIAMVFAIRYPERVNRLILNGANLYSAGVKPSVQVPIILGYYMASLFRGISKKAKSNAEMLGLMVKDPNLKEEELQKIHCKTLVIAGTDDMIKKDHTKQIHRGIKDSCLVFLEGDHFIAKKKPREFCQAVRKFLMAENC